MANLERTVRAGHLWVPLASASCTLARVNGLRYIPGSLGSTTFRAQEIKSH